MYITLRWVEDNDNYLTAIKNKDGSIRLFETLKEADEYANKHKKTDYLRVISIDAVKDQADV